MKVGFANTITIYEIQTKYLLYDQLQMLQNAKISTLLLLSRFPNQPVLSKKHCQRHNGPLNWQLLTMKKKLSRLPRNFFNIDLNINIDININNKHDDEHQQYHLLDACDSCFFRLSKA